MTSANRIAATLATVLTLSAPPLLAGTRGGSGAADGSGPLHDFTTCVPQEATGTVSALGYNGGYELDLGDGSFLTVYGIGSQRFWDTLGVESPQVGEEIGVTYCIIEFSDGSSKAIATSVAVGEDWVLLRDPDSGAPVWRGPRTEAAAAPGRTR